jgi:hypothetical protein
VQTDLESMRFDFAAGQLTLARRPLIPRDADAVRRRGSRAPSPAPVVKGRASRRAPESRDGARAPAFGRLLVAVAARGGRDQAGRRDRSTSDPGHGDRSSRIVAVSSQVPLLDLRTLGAPLAPYAARVAALRVNGESSSPSSSSPPHQRVPFSSSSPSHAHTRRRRRRHHHRQAPLVLITPIFRLRAASPPTLRLGAARRMAAATRAQTMRRRAGAA